MQPISIVVDIRQFLAFVLIVSGFADPVFAQGLEQRVSTLEALLRPQTLTVNCGAGQTVADALGQVSTAAPVTVTISGTCTEAVVLNRDDVTLQGSQASDGLQAPAASVTVIAVINSQRVVLRQLTITGGSSGLVASGSGVLGVNPIRS
jgi:hypothetical protein